MNPVIFYYVGGPLFALGFLMVRNTERYQSEGGSSFERMQTRRLLGIIALIAATLLVGLGLLTQFD